MCKCTKCLDLYLNIIYFSKEIMKVYYRTTQQEMGRKKNLFFLPLLFFFLLSSTHCSNCLPLFLFLQVRLLYCSLEEAELIFRAAWAAGQAGPSHMWFAVGPALSGLGLEGLPKALFAIRPQGWRDEPRRYEPRI